MNAYLHQHWFELEIVDQNSNNSNSMNKQGTKNTIQI